jgi:hypothetical protein
MPQRDAPRVLRRGEPGMAACQLMLLRLVKTK